MGDRLPAPVRNRRDKLGFAAPEAAWLADDLPTVHAILSEGQTVARGWVSHREVLRLVNDHNHVHTQLWRLLVIECWLRLTYPGAAGKGAAAWDAALETERNR